MGSGVARTRVAALPANRREGTTCNLSGSQLQQRLAELLIAWAYPTDAIDLQSRATPIFAPGEHGSLNVYEIITLARSIAPLVPKNEPVIIQAGILGEGTETAQRGCLQSSV